MRYAILVLLMTLGLGAFGQGAPTSAKTQFKNGIALGSKDSTAFGANDSLFLTIDRNGALLWRGLGANAVWRSAGSTSDLANYLLKSDSLSGGYTTWLLTKKKIDSLGALKLNISDTASMLAPFVQYSDTAGLYSQVVRTFGTQTIGGNKTITNDLTLNGMRLGRGVGNDASNTVFGTNVFGSNSGGVRNTAYGERTLGSNTSGIDNTAIGWYAVDATNSGSGNVGVGSGALGNNTTGSNNIGIGYGAGEFITGLSPNSTGGNSIFIGYNAKAAANGETNQIVIGHNGLGNGSNTVTIGNSSITNNYFNGNIRGGAFIKSGGTSSQFLKADGSVDATAYGTGTVTSISAGTGMSFTTITSSGAVNADTTVLATRAYAAGLDVAKANTSLNNVNGVLSSTYGGAGSVSGILKANGSGVVSAAGAADIPSLSAYYVDLTSTQTVGGSKTFTNRFFGGSLSINNTGSSARLQVTGVNSEAIGYFYNNSGAAGLVQGVIIEAGTNASDYSFDARSSTGTSYLKVRGDGQTLLGGALSGTSASFSGGVNMATSSGNVGIGTTSPATKFNVVGGGTTTGIANVGTTVNTRFDVANPSVSLGIGYLSGDFPLVQAFNNGTNSVVPLALNPFGAPILINTSTNNGTDVLQVNGSGLFTGVIKGDVVTWNSGTGALSYGGGAVSVETNTATPIQLKTNGTTALTLASNQAANFSSSVTATGFSTTSTSGISINSGDGVIDWSSGLRFRVFISGTGYVTPLTLNNTTGAITASSSVTANSFLLDELGVRSWSITKSSGNLRFASGDLNGSFIFANGTASTSTTTGALVISGGLGVASAGYFGGNVTATGFFESSDIRLKSIIKRDGDVAYFKWKNGSDNKTHIGYIAQEVQKTSPDQVKADEKGMLSVNYTEVLVQKVRALEKRIAELENKLK